MDFKRWMHRGKIAEVLCYPMGGGRFILYLVATSTAVKVTVNV
jgi:hypothetical protein